MRERIRRLLAGTDLDVVESRKAFSVRLKRRCSPGIAALRNPSAADTAWLLDAVRPPPANRSCVVVAPLSLFNLQRLRPLRRDVFRVVWDEEADDRLASVVKDVMAEWCRDPLVRLGRQLLEIPELRPSLHAVIARLCRLSSDGPPRPPPRTVTELAGAVHLSPGTLARYWRSDVPLRCGPKKLLIWAAFLWAVERSSQAKWDTVAKLAGTPRRTLERWSLELADCTLSEAARDPSRVFRRFEAWVAEVYRPS